MNENSKDIVRLRHILDAISEIESYLTDKHENDFIENTMLQSACIRQLEIIGEAAGKLSVNIVEENTDVSWREIIGLRNILIHDYFGVDLNIVWQILNIDIPLLKDNITQIIKSL